MSEPGEPRFSETLTVLTGYRFHNWEHGHTLYAMGLDGPVCLDGDGARSELSEIEGVRFAEIHGYLSERGAYGGVTQCPYIFKVAEVIEDRAVTQSETEVAGALLRVIADPGAGEIPGAGFEQYRTAAANRPSAPPSGN